MTGHAQNRGVVRTLIDNSALLVAGAVIALVWANMHTESYNNFVHFDVTSLWSDHAAEGHVEPVVVADGADAHGDHADSDGAVHAAHGFSLHFIVNDILMALFFAIAAKEVWESLLPGGPLSDPRKAATPLLATVGGILGPALVYLAGCYFTGTYASLGDGWAVPCATDIAFSYLIARIIFGAGHPAIAFLLLLAIADDAAGLMILAIFYPQAPIVPQWLLL
ncbi:MAG: Na+/H+ antiporter NhaA, partial [Rubripirellula sp.]